MRVVACVMAVMLMIGLAGVPALGQSPAYLMAKQALALVETSAGTGSGFAVSPNLVATACHVVKGAAGIRVHFWSAKVQLPARAAMCNERQDIAFVAVPVPEGTTILKFAAAPPSQGDRIWVWGYPLGTTIALEPSVAAGMISATETPGGFLALDVSGAPGNSEGPVINEAGEVVGILVGMWNVRDQGSTGFKYAAPGIAAARMLSELPATTVAQEHDHAQPAGNGIRPGEGIGSVQLGMTPAQVQAAIGLPPSRSNGRWYDWDTRKLSVLFDNGKAVIIFTEDPTAGTAEAIRLGSTDVDLIKTYGKPACSSLFSASGKAMLGWVYHGMVVFLTGSPRQISALAVVPNGFAHAICR
jgi:hypothetical protein